MTLPKASTKVWRYMKYLRFKQLIETGELFFPSYETLNDSFEMTIEDAKYRDMIEEDRNHIVISCWSLHYYEQYNLWETYTKGNKDGVAIVTTYSNLSDALKDYPHEIIPGIVKYRNTLNDSILLRDHPKGRQKNFLRYVFFKKRYFRSDNELRLFRYHMIPNGLIPIVEPVGVGISIPCHLKNLINYIVLSPYANRFVKRKVRRLLNSNGLNDIQIKNSDIKIRQ